MHEPQILVQELLTRMGINAEVETRALADLSLPYVNILTREGRMLMGGRNESIAALEYLVRRMMERQDEKAAVFIDVNGWRLHRMETLKTDAKSAAKRVRLYRTELALEPMNAFERRIVHTALAEYPDVTTESIGEGRSRRVVIKPYP